MVKKFRPHARVRNLHKYVRSTECVIYNDIVQGAPDSYLVSSDPVQVLSPGLVTVNNYFNPYGQSSIGGSSVMTFALDKTPNHTEFGPLYDFYKIEAVRVTFEYSANVATADATSVPMPKIILFRDYDDNLPVTDWHEVMQRRSQTIRKRLEKPFSVVVRPNVPAYVARDIGISSAAASVKTPWLDLNSPNIQHLGLKFMIVDWPADNEPADLTSRPILRVRMDYYLAFKDVR